MSDFVGEEHKEPSDSASDGFVPVEYQQSEESSFLEFERLSEESSIDSGFAQLSVGSCVILGTASGKRGEQTEVSDPPEHTVVIEKLPFQQTSYESDIEGEKDDTRSELSYMTASTYQNNVDICTNSPGTYAHEDMIKTAADLMFVPESAAGAILEHFNWDMNELCEKYVGNEERVWSLCHVRDQCMAHRSRPRAPDGEKNSLMARPSVMVCPDCGLENHAPLTCPQFEKWTRKCEEEEGSIRWLLENTVKCPVCALRFATNVAFDSVVCERCSFLINTKGQAVSKDEHEANQDPDEWFIHCLDKFKFHKKNEDIIKEKLRSFFVTAMRARDGKTAYRPQVINQLIECHHVLKFSCAALYFKGSSPNALIEHRRKLLESLAQDLSEVALDQNWALSEVALDQEGVGRPGWLVSRTAAVGRLVSGLLDDFEGLCDGNLEPPCESARAHDEANNAMGRYTTPRSTPQPVQSVGGGVRTEEEKEIQGDVLSVADTGGVLWCQHPDCLESIEPFSTHNELSQHYFDAHDSDVGDEQGNVSGQEGGGVHPPDYRSRSDDASGCSDAAGVARGGGMRDKTDSAVSLEDHNSAELGTRKELTEDGLRRWVGKPEGATTVPAKADEKGDFTFVWHGGALPSSRRRRRAPHGYSTADRTAIGEKEEVVKEVVKEEEKEVAATATPVNDSWEDLDLAGLSVPL